MNEQIEAYDDNFLNVAELVRASFCSSRLTQLPFLQARETERREGDLETIMQQKGQIEDLTEKLQVAETRYTQKIGWRVASFLDEQISDCFQLGFTRRSLLRRTSLQGRALSSRSGIVSLCCVHLILCKGNESQV